MRNWIFRASALAFAAGLTGALACGSSSSCGGTNINGNTSSTPAFVETCGPGTYQANGKCYGNSSGSSATSGVNSH